MSTPRAAGSWPSPFSPEQVAAGARRLGETRLAQGRATWLETRPEEGGRQVVMGVAVAVGDGVGSPAPVSPDGVNVRSRVHEYGGGAYWPAPSALYYVDDADRRAHGPAGALGDPEVAVADLLEAPAAQCLLAVEERPRPGGREPEARLAALPLDGGPSRALFTGTDFVSSPCLSPDGRELAFLTWDHPCMPWDGTRLWRAGLDPDGPRLVDPRPVAGGDDESLFQPRFAADGSLVFVSDRSGWWNLHRLAPDATEATPLCPREEEFGEPQWVFGLSTWDFVAEDRIVCRIRSRGRDRLACLDLSSGALHERPLPYHWIEGVRCEGRRVVFAGASPSRAAEVACVDLESGGLRVLQTSLPDPPDPAWISEPEWMEFESRRGRRARAFFYPPRSPDFRPTEGERPPLLVKGHGGPTSAARPALDPAIQFWTSRGFAVVDVDYTGSSGYGRAVREALLGQWGVADVEDCVEAAFHLAGEGRVDPDRMLIRGGSAGGYTTLCALAFHDVFAAGASYYGIGDLEALVRDTHKFESRYTDRLVAPYPEGREVYRARSPLHHADGITCPVIFFQGLEDKVVPPGQAEAMVAAMARRGVPHAYVPFEGEQHGFRRAEHIAEALACEWAFYAEVLGFAVEEAPERLRRALAGGRGRDAGPPG